ncbi:MAG TPA: hypothetical protein DCZ19_06555 [Porphyromonadaceae bacterium]|nr:hypothetical protein [Porphyromonadaceae bacterium]HCC19346.1 hypothetical protein [Porphyromonadaceae bacterium]
MSFCCFFYMDTFAQNHKIMAKTLELIGEVGRWGISMQFVKTMMDDLGKGPIVVKCTSLGGDLNHALKIKEMFETHGDVTLEYVGFNASAATIIGHGAVKSRIREDSFYLIHKPSIWVDAWGNMNEDDLDQTINDLIAQKKEAEVFTLSVAQDYVKSRGIDFKTVMNLMKESRWLSAKEAVELGLVDELVPVKTKEKVAVSNETAAKMKALDLPVPVMKETEPIEITTEMVNKMDEKDKKSLFQMLMDIFSPKNKTEMKKDFQQINTLLKVEGFEEKEGNVIVSIDQMKSLDAEIKTITENAAKVSEATNALQLVLDLLDDLDPTVKASADAAAKVAAVKAKLAARPAAAAENPQGGSSNPAEVKDETDWNTIDNLPHNKIADAEII